VIHVFCNLEEEPGDDLPMCDMTFEIAEQRFDEANNCWRLRCKADADPCGVVGFDLDIPMTGWNEQVDGEGDDAFHSFWGQVRLHSVGPESDQLIALMADYYGIAPGNRPTGGLLGRLLKSPACREFVSDIDCLCVGIASDPRTIEAGPIHMKMFFDDGVENGRYAEVFLDVDLLSGFVMMNEKDEEYRADLVHWLSGLAGKNANPHSASGTIDR
jgi:hypothetical protein